MRLPTVVCIYGVMKYPSMYLPDWYEIAREALVTEQCFVQWRDSAIEFAFVADCEELLCRFTFCETGTERRSGVGE